MKTTARLINVIPWEALRVVCNVCRGRGGHGARGGAASGSSKTGFTRDSSRVLKEG